MDIGTYQYTYNNKHREMIEYMNEIKSNINCTNRKQWIIFHYEAALHGFKYRMLQHCWLLN